MSTTAIHKDEPQPARTAPARTFVQRLAHLQVLPIAGATVLLFIVSAIVAPNSLISSSLLATIVPASVMAVAGIGQTLVIQQKGIDLSVAGSITLSAMVFATVASKSSGPVALIVCLIVAVLGGLLNGFIVAKWSITPIIATLASNFLLYGVVWFVSGGVSVAAPDYLIAFSSMRAGSFSIITVIAIILVAIVAILMVKTPTGRRFVGVGSSPSAARASGVAVTRYVIGAYIASGFFGGIAGVLLLGYLGNSSLTLGNSYQLTVIAAVVVGGAALSGGRGSVVATAIGALFLAQVVQVVLTLGAPTSTQLLVQAAALAIAAGLRVVPIRKLISRKRSRTSAPA